MEIVVLILRVFLAGVFGVAAAGKLVDMEGSRKAVVGFGIPAALAAPIGYVLPFIELAIALLFLSVLTSFYASVSAFAILLIFVVGMAWQMAKGNAPDCHCFGVVHSEPVGPSSIIRNIVLAAAAAFLGFRGPLGQGLSFADMERDVAILFGVSVTVIATLLIVIFRMKFRMELLEQASGINAEVERDGVGHPDDALPIGAPVPDFELPDAEGRITSFDMLLMRGRPMLLLFVGANCGPCKSLLPEVEAWQREFAGKLELVLVSSGTVEDNIAKFGRVGRPNILVQKAREVSQKFRANWTPSAVFISDGMVASRVAVGDTQIRDLVDGLRTRDLSKGFVFVPRGTPARVRIGEKVQPFRVTDIEGREVSNSYIEGKRTLVLFWSTTCPHCVAMMPDVKDWERNRNASDPQLLIFSDGNEAVYRELGLASPIVIDKDNSTADKFGKHGAPAAVIVDEDGVISTETAIGTDAIWSLIGKQ